MKKKEGAAAIEAILFTMGDSVEVSKLADALEESIEEVKEQIEYLKDKYKKNDSGINLLELKD